MGTGYCLNVSTFINIWKLSSSDICHLEELIYAICTNTIAECPAPWEAGDSSVSVSTANWPALPL